MAGGKLYLTKRMVRIMKKAEEEMGFSQSKALLPVHLLIACLQEKKGALGEMALKCEINVLLLRVAAKEIEVTEGQINHPFFSVPISRETEKVLEMSKEYMERYKQIYLNEGHLLKALISANGLNDLLTEKDKETILTLGTTSRDMITFLGNYTFPDIQTPLIRRVTKNDKPALVRFVEEHFSNEWSQTIKTGFQLDELNMYIAVETNGTILGFAAFDIFQNKKCYFGPMGVMKTNRTKGIGYLLLHHCLRDMKEIGYEYAIIGGAGPIEFYEQACHAVVIPMS